MVSNGSAVMFFLYGACAATLTVIMAHRLYNTPRSAYLLNVSRFGIILLTFGTTVDNFRQFAGCYEDFNVNNASNIAATWFCIIDHEFLSSIAITIPFQFMRKTFDDEVTKRRMTYLSITIPTVFAIVGIVGFAQATWRSCVYFSLAQCIR